MKRIRSMLCVPAHKPELYEKACRTAADSLVFDLEDAVPAPHKAGALDLLVNYLRSVRDGIDKTIAVRINLERAPIEVPALAPLVDCLVVPKIELADPLYASDLVWAGPLLPIVETPLALLNLRGILAVPSVIGVIFGLADFAAGLGVNDRLWTDNHTVDPECEAVNGRFVYAKQKIATACAAYGKQALDTCLRVKGTAAAQHVRFQWAEARSWGFTGAFALNPMQAGVANEVFGRGAAEHAWAEAIHAGHAERHGEAGVDEEGMIVGPPADRQARAIIARRDT